MSIELLCSRCSKLLNLSGFDAVNEVGRKHCVGCGNNEDDLVVVNKRECDAAIDSYNAMQLRKNDETPGLS